MSHFDAPRPRRLSVRLGAAAADNTPYDGVPAHLDVPLRSWARTFLHPALEQRVALQLQIPLHHSGLREALDAVHGRSRGHLIDQLQSGEQLLDAVDLALQLDQSLHWEIDVVGLEDNPHEASLADWIPTHHWPRTSSRARSVDTLAQLLRDADSVFEVGWSTPTRLIHRVDPATATAFDHTMAAAPPTAGQLLRAAWTATYGLHPDPTTAYRDAVRAVESVACPLVCPTNTRATLGTVVRDLRGGPRKWRFILVDRDGADTIDPLLGMLDRLWTGQVSRHGGGQNSRDQTPGRGRGRGAPRGQPDAAADQPCAHPPGHDVTDLAEVGLAALAGTDEQAAELTAKTNQFSHA